MSDSYRKLFQLSLPSMLSLSIEPVAGVVDTILVGQYAASSMPTLAISNSIVSAFFWMLSFLSTTLMSHTARGSSAQQHAMNEKISVSILIACVFSIVISTLLLTGSSQIFALYNVAEQHEYETFSYLALRLAALPFALFCSCANGVLRGLQQFKTQLYLALFLTVTNIVISFCLVTYLQHAVIGCGIGTLLSFVITSTVSFVLLHKKYDIRLIKPSAHFLKNDFLELQKDSWNVFLRSSSLVLSLLLMTVCISRIHHTALAAHQILLQVWLFASFMMDGFGVTATALCGRAYANQDAPKFKAIGLKFLIMSCLSGLTYGIICAFLFRPFALLFTQNQQVHNTLYQPWMLMAALQVIGACVYLFDGLLYATGNFVFMRRRMMEALLCIYLPILYFFGDSFLGVWIAFSGLIFYRFISSAHHFRKSWQHVAT